LLTIAKGQLALEESFESAVGSQQMADSTISNQEGSSSVIRRLFIDTDMYVMKIWCEFVFGDCHQWILNRVVERKYSLYLLCKPDLPWVKDELREYPDLESREKLYHIYRDLLINQATPWAEISGGHEERLQKAITAVDAL
jgi:nicotinamide riboside kinase